ncbi:MAG: Trk system potassium transporter TrkA [Roseburia sp.]
MNIIIAGDGKVGRTLTRKLSGEGHDLTLIDLKQNVIDSSVEQYDVMAVQGNCASMQVLLDAGVKKADLLIAATGADEINLLSCMTAHGMNENIHTIARIRNPEYTNQIYGMRDVFALSMVVNPERQTAQEIERLLKYPGFLRRDTFARGRVEIVELRVDSDSKLCNVALNDLAGIVKCKVLVCAVRRDGVVEIPDGTFVLREGDRIFVTASTDSLTTLLKNLGVITHKVKRVILCGGGRISYYLAELLQKSGITVQLIEQDRERCVELSNLLPNVCVIHGDASNQFLLESEGIDSSDAVVTLTGLDEMNMIISLYAQKCGVFQVITKVGHMENSSIQDSLSLGSVVCPKELCCNNIVRYVRAMQNKTGAALTVHTIADGQAEALEFMVEESFSRCGIPLKDLRTKRNVLIVSITHKNKTELPNGESSIEVGDTVIVVVNGDMVIHQLEDIFE